MVIMLKSAVCRFSFPGEDQQPELDSSTSTSMSEPTLYSIGGLRVHIHGLSTLIKTVPVTVLFLIHGRLGSEADFLCFVTILDIPTLNARPDRKRQL
jgi:hypothetical protein